LALGIDPRRVLRVDLQRRLKICDDDGTTARVEKRRESS